MTFLEVLRMTFGALTANRARSALTVLSITIGAFAIVVMSSLAESGFKTLERGIEELGGARILGDARPEPAVAAGADVARSLRANPRRRLDPRGARKRLDLLPDPSPGGALNRLP